MGCGATAGQKGRGSFTAATYTWRKEQWLSRIAASRPFDVYVLFGEAPSDLRSDRSVFQRALEKAGPDWAHAMLGSAPQELREDRDLFLRALELSSGWRVKDIYALAPLSLKADKEVLLRALALSSGSYADLVLRDACQSLRDDKEVVLLAVTANAFALQHASKHLRSDPDIQAAAQRDFRDSSPRSSRISRQVSNQIGTEERLSTKAIRHSSLGGADEALCLRFGLDVACIEFGASKRKPAKAIGCEHPAMKLSGSAIKACVLLGEPDAMAIRLKSSRIVAEKECLLGPTQVDRQIDEDLAHTADPAVAVSIGCQCHGCGR